MMFAKIIIDYTSNSNIAIILTFNFEVICCLSVALNHKKTIIFSADVLVQMVVGTIALLLWDIFVRLKYLPPYI